MSDKNDDKVCCPKCGSKRKNSHWLPVSHVTVYTCADCGQSYQKTK